MNEKIGVAIIGGGYGGRVLLPVCLEHPMLQTKWVVTNHSANLQIPSSVNLSHDINEVVSDESVGLVLIASPHHFHEEHLRKSMEAGKHSLVQKPIALEIPDAMQLVILGRSQRVVSAIDYSFNYIPSRQLFRDLLQSGEIGVPRYLKLSFHRDDFDKWPAEWYKDSRKGGGAIFATGMHLISSARYILNDAIAQLNSKVYFTNNIDVGFFVFAETQKGINVAFDVSHRTSGYGKHLIEARGSHGSLYLQPSGEVFSVKQGINTKHELSPKHSIGFNNLPWEGNFRLQPTARIIDTLVSKIQAVTVGTEIDLDHAVYDLKVALAIKSSHEEIRRIDI